ncbi:TPA: hypothetical protein ACGW65_006086 [Bacillus paranthracis]
MEIEISNKRYDPRDQADIAREAKLIDTDITDFAMLQAKIFQDRGGN